MNVMGCWCECLAGICFALDHRVRGVTGYQLEDGIEIEHLEQQEAYPDI